MSKQTFKIIGNGKGTRTEYKSLKEAKSIIVKNKIQPLVNKSYILVEEVITKLHKISVNVQKLSTNNKKFLVDYVLNHLTEETIEGRNLSNVLYCIKYQHTTHPVLRDLLVSWAIDTYKVKDSELESALLIEEIYNTPLFKRMDNIIINRKGYVYCIKRLLETTNLEELNFTYNLTNYKPCHNIMIELPYTVEKQERSFTLQIRKEDFPYNVGTCYGRNTTCVKTFNLHDENFDKYCKSLNIK